MVIPNRRQDANFETSRRQNVSCDPCRRSKKRCVSRPGLPRGSGASCQNCAHLGHICTFKFASARQAEKKAKALASPQSQPSQNHESTTSSASVPIPADNTASSETTWPSWEATVPEDMWLDDKTWAGIGPNTYLDFASFLNGESQSLMNTPRPTVALPSHEASDTVIVGTIPPVGASIAAENERTGSSGHTSTDGLILSGQWHGSPVQLLNSRTVSQQMTRSLCHIYDTMMIGVTRRYLSYSSNLFAGKHSYVLAPDRIGEAPASPTCEGALGFPMSPTLSTREPMLANPEVSHSSSAASRPMTLIGAARFLDNFGALYGNVLDRKKRKQDEATLLAVLQAFALQFAPPSDEESEDTENTTALLPEVSNWPPPATRMTVFTAAWFNAFTHLNESVNNRSFVHLYAVILFQMVAEPAQVSIKDAYLGRSAKLLDRALQSLCKLSNLLDTFCSGLDAKSRYRTLLDSSRRIMYWFGYIRDTMTSFLSDRPCVLKDAPVSIPGVYFGTSRPSN
jgi:hypothetical protein